MSFRVLMLLLFGLLIAVFAAQNVQPLTIRLLGYSWETSLVVVIIGTAVVGGLAIGLPALFQQLAMRRRIREAQQRLQQAESELAELRRQLDAAPRPDQEGDLPSFTSEV